MGLAIKIGKKVGSSKWEKSLVFGKFDNASHDPLDSASDPLLVTLLPLVQQGPHNGLLRVLSRRSPLLRWRQVVRT